MLPPRCKFKNTTFNSVGRGRNRYTGFIKEKNQEKRKTKDFFFKRECSVLFTKPVLKC